MIVSQIKREQSLVELCNGLYPDVHSKAAFSFKKSHDFAVWALYCDCHHPCVFPALLHWNAPLLVFAAFISLLDNYESDTGEPEIVTPEEVAENHKFLDSIIQTPTMKVPMGAFDHERHRRLVPSFANWQKTQSTAQDGGENLVFYDVNQI